MANDFVDEFQMEYNLDLILSFLICFQLLFLGVFLATTKKGSKKSNRILASIFILISWNMADLIYRLANPSIAPGLLSLFDDTFFFLYGPLIWWYTQTVIISNYKLARIRFLHVLPFLCANFLLMASSASSSLTMESSHTGAASLVVTFLIYGHPLSYLGFAYLSVYQYRIEIKNRFSKVEHINMNWLIFTFRALLVLTILSLLHNLFLIGNFEVFGLSLFTLLIFIFYFINNVIFKALNQSELFAGIEQGNTLKYSGSNLTQNQVDTYHQHLLTIFEQEKPYLKDDISILELAEMMNISTKSLSQVINQSFSKSYFDFINSFRIKEARLIMEKSQDKGLTILEIMYKVGFNSKSSFNTAFKKETGQTPTEFKKSILK